MSDKTENIIIVGGGLMGSATAWQLSKYGEEVLLIEQQDAVYNLGSSFGEARISRSLGPKNDIFSYLQQISVSETQNLINFLNEDAKIFHKMEDIYTTSPITYLYYCSQSKEVKNILEGQTDRYEFASNAKEAFQMFGMKIPETATVIREYKPFSGTLNPRVLINKLHEGIQKKGNKIRYNEKVTSVKRSNGIYEIETCHNKTGEKQLLKCKRVVFAAGPYNGNLTKDIAPYFSKLINPKRLFLAFLSIKRKTYKSLTEKQINKLHDFYPFVDFNPEIFYSMIEKICEDGVPLLKIGGHMLRNDITDLDQIWQKELSAVEIDWSKKNTASYMAMLDLPVQIQDLEYSGGYSCVYSMTETEVPYVTNIINNKSEIESDFVLIGGMSGIGAKGSLAYGLIAANILLNKDNSSPMYQKTKAALGTERLIEDLQKL